MTDDVLISLPTTCKARTEEIVIRNQDPAARRVDVYQSLRPVAGDKMGEPIARTVRSVPVDSALSATTINGITGQQVMEWLAEWAARINAEDAAGMAARVGV